MMGLKHFSRWEKMAIVSDQKVVEKMSHWISPMLPGETKGFRLEELEQAGTWVAEEN